jgi:molybdate-binding protein/DNA-binding XRE family transcriptional regulator
MAAQIQNQLGAIRRGRGISASRLAERVGVSRQTIYAIEAGSYVPNTEVTLKLARELEVAVEQLFSLQQENPPAREPVESEFLSATPALKDQAVRFCRVGDRLVSVPVSASPYFLPESDGIVVRTNRSSQRAGLIMLSEAHEQRRIVLAGCDPAIGLISQDDVEIVAAPASSKLALRWLKDGKVHIAGSHLEDPQTGEFNVPFIRREFSQEDFTVVTFARWEEGYVTARGNPKGIRDIAHVADADVRFVNREPGSGSRALFDRLLRNAGIPSAKVFGYDRIANGHLAAAFAVLAGEADCCLATRSASQAFGLDFVPVQMERYDLVMRKQSLEIPGVQTLLDVLQRANLRRKLESVAGYDTEETGKVIA